MSMLCANKTLEKLISVLYFPNFVPLCFWSPNYYLKEVVIGTILGCPPPHYPMCLSELEHRVKTTEAGFQMSVCLYQETGLINVIRGTQVVQTIRFISSHPSIIER